MFWFHIMHSPSLKVLELPSSALPITPRIGDVLDLAAVVKQPDLGVFKQLLLVAQVIIRPDTSTPLSGGGVLPDGGSVVLRVVDAHGTSMHHAPPGDIPE